MAFILPPKTPPGEYNARSLHSLLTLSMGFDLKDVPEDQRQSVLAAYVPPEGDWSPRAEVIRRSFATMDPDEFKALYAQMLTIPDLWR